MARTGKARLTLRPGDPGTKRLTEEYRDKLVAVRYRMGRESVPGGATPSRPRAVGPAGKLWWIFLRLVTELGLEERIAAWDIPREGISSKV